MPDITFRGTPYGDVTIYESWPPWLKTTWIDALAKAGFHPPAPAYVPTYDVAEVHWPQNDGTMASALIDQFQLASQSTAMWLAVKYGAPRVVPLPFVGQGPVASAAVVRYVQWANGVMIIAGFMARAFTLNPEDQFPGVADKAVREMMRIQGAA